MTIDINALRVDKGGDPERVRQSELKRGRDGKVIDEIILKDADWRQKIFEIENLKKEVNAVSKEIGTRKKANRDDACADLVTKSNGLKTKVPELEAALAECEDEREALLKKIGNFVHQTVVESSNEDENECVRTWGAPNTHLSPLADVSTPGRLRHHEILAKLEGHEPKKGIEIAGHRGYFLKGYGVMLNLALQQYGLAFLRRKLYTPIYPPFFMKREVMSQTAELADFAETLYKIPMMEGKTGVSAKDSDRDDLFLIATSEQPISALHRGEYIEEKSLPYRYAGNSTCFRKEAGSHGKDTWGIFRVHQFEKVEQFCITTPENSWAMHEEMIRTAEEFYQSLDLPYRVVSIVAGALNDAAAKKYDLEAWFPGYGTYKELVSCSNCTDYQARALGIRLGCPKQGEREKRYVHMLNATLVATQRAICCILENYQTPTGVRVPRVLVPFMDGLEFLEFPTQPAAESS